MSLLLLLRNHQSGTTPPPPVVEDDSRGPGGELIWPASIAAAPAKPNIPIIFKQEPVGKPKKILDEEDLLLLLELFDDD